MTIKQLWETTWKVSDSRKHYKQAPKVISKSVIPSAGTSTVLFQTSVWGMSVKAVHEVNIQFYKNEVVMENPNDEKFFKVKHKDRDFWVKKPELSKTPVNIRCSCDDFRYTFAYYNSVEKALFGPKPPKYTPKSNRPPRNPGHYPGFCHHVADSLSMLRSSKNVID